MQREDIKPSPKAETKHEDYSVLPDRPDHRFIFGSIVGFFFGIGVGLYGGSGSFIGLAILIFLFSLCFGLLSLIGKRVLWFLMELLFR